jgi:hypothetical protein
MGESTGLAELEGSETPKGFSIEPVDGGIVEAPNGLSIELGAGAGANGFSIEPEADAEAPNGFSTELLDDIDDASALAGGVEVAKGFSIEPADVDELIAALEGDGTPKGFSTALDAATEVPNGLAIELCKGWAFSDWFGDGPGTAYGLSMGLEGALLATSEPIGANRL